MPSTAAEPSKWRSDHIWKMPDEVEPVLIVTILLLAMCITRRRNYSILRGRIVRENRKSLQYSHLHSSPLESPGDGVSCTSSDDDAFSQSASSGTLVSSAEPRHPPKFRRLFGIWTVRTPNSSRFARHFHSRILVKFPFLIEMFYWAISFFFYRLTAVMTQIQYGGAKGLWDIAQGHGIAILELESWLSGFGSVTGNERWAEYRIQQWFLTGADGGDFRGIWLTILDRGYSLIHIPGTVGFIAFYYWYSPSFSTFATVRRTMTLTNMFAFVIFLLYPTMPPRFLPGDYGFVDTVNAEDAQSVWMSGQFVNKLAAMPSMHFGYAFCIGCTFVYESGFLQRFLAHGPMHFLVDADEGEDEGEGVGDEDKQQTRVYTAECDKDTSYDSLPESMSGSGSGRVVAMMAYGGNSSHEKTALSRSLFLFCGIFYPAWILLTIVATANHYFLDAAVAVLVVLLAYMCNRVLLNFFPLEDWLLWAWRLEKPQPTTGWRRRKLRSSV